MKVGWKRGQSSVSQAILILIGIFLAFVGIAAAINIIQHDDAVGEAIANGFGDVGGGIMTVLGPLFNLLLNLQNDTNTNFLMVLSFILIVIIIVGTLDSVQIFGQDDKQGKIVNFAIGIIVAIIGVRFMPADLWSSLTAPSSAFVATILVGAPFAALFFATMKIKSPLVGKLLWTFYLVFMSYLIFFPSEGAGFGNDFMWIYIVFLVLAGIMMFFDSTVRDFISREKHKLELSKLKSDLSVKDRAKYRQQIKEWREIASDPDAPENDKKQARRKLNRLEQEYGNLDSI